MEIENGRYEKSIEYSNGTVNEVGKTIIYGRQSIKQNGYCLRGVENKNFALHLICAGSMS